MIYYKAIYTSRIAHLADTRRFGVKGAEAKRGHERQGQAHGEQVLVQFLRKRLSHLNAGVL